MIRLLSHFVFVMFFFATAHAGPVKSPAKLPAFDELADGTRDVRAAVGQAAAEGRLVMLVFGANWSAESRGFDEDMNAADLGSLLALSYVVVKVDVGRLKKNLDVAARYGVPVRQGLPAVALVSGEDRTLMVVDGPKMEELRREGRPRVVRFFDAALNPDQRAWLIQQQEKQKLDRLKQGLPEQLRPKFN